MTEATTGRIEVPLPVTRVTAFEDRAELTRQTTTSLKAGLNRLVARGVTPLTHEAHLGAQTSVGRVERIRVVRRLTERGATDPDRLFALAVDLRLAEQALDVARAARGRAEQRRTAASGILGRFAERLARTAWLPDAAPARWPDGLDALEQVVDAATTTLAAARAAESEADAAARRQRALVDAAGARRPRPVCDLEIDVFADAAGPATLTVRGVVPCAMWRPSHEAHLREDARLAWTTHGTVWQATGEDWDAIELVLSTDRPGAGATLPEVVADRPALQPKVEKKRIVLEHRTEAARKDDGRDAVPGVYDGGEPRELSPPGRVSIPADGRPHKVAVGGFTTTATLARVCRPELAPHVFWRAALANEAATPILAGPVTLQRDGAWVGQGDVVYVGPGERFEQSFGSDDRWSVRCRRVRRTEERMLAKDRTHFVTEVTLTWAGAGEGEAEVGLRLPVSELRALEIKPSERWCSEGTPHPDEDGLVRLTVRLQPGELRELTVGFVLEKSGDLVLPDPW